MAATHFVPPAEEHASDAGASGPSTGAPVATGRACQCGHIEGAHEHYRRGTDCALCPCARFRKADRHLRRQS
ncbi:hypothetical protein GCM10027448_38490 [Nocardioides dilutus]